MGTARASQGTQHSFTLLTITIWWMQESLEDLNSKLEQRLPMNRFRPNIVVSGVRAAAASFAEHPSASYFAACYALEQHVTIQ